VFGSTVLLIDLNSHK